MTTIFDKLERYLLPVAEAFSKNTYLNAIRDAFLVNMPLLIAGSIFLLIAAFPIPGYGPFMADLLGENWSSYMWGIADVTFGMMGLITAISVGYNLAKAFKLDALMIAVLTLICFLLLLPFSIELDQGGSIKGLSLEYLGAKGIFVSIFVGILVTHIVKFVMDRKLYIKMPESVPEGVARSFNAIVPVFLTLAVFIAIKVLVDWSSFESLHSIIYSILQRPLQNVTDGPIALAVIVLFEQLLWVLGIHGGMVVNSVMTPVLDSLAIENYSAFLAGEQVPYIVSSSFRSVYLLMGGSGLTLGLIIAVFIVGRSRQLKSLSKMALPANVFNVNEPIIFGMPLILNPVMLIPWVLGPVLIALFTYFVTYIGLVPSPNGMPIPWTTPIFISGFLTAGVKGAVMQLINLVLITLIYLPFVRILDRQYYHEELQEEKESEAQIAVPDLGTA
ncbi:PTS sugar transporter subunit IIC [Psychromonas aquimarina]|uniref:PTS sugar transporter subunit IIC n=1 Tax=Psychromonas aquimarina TaxID=444919 RepID=UPI0004158DFF|nr:PTS sugar transporter subunit IIC [Psychromonas aquimarina]